MHRPVRLLKSINIDSALIVSMTLLHSPFAVSLFVMRMALVPQRVIVAIVKF
jgi:hypothetical protein